MAHKFPIKEIAHQAGLSVATVDRVLNHRPGVRRATVNRVHAAIADLGTQEAQIAMAGRKLTIDLLVEAPQSAATDIAFILIIFFLVCASVQPDTGRDQLIPRSEEQP